MKFVVTGALGHIGSRLIRELPKAFAGSEIVMVDNMMTQRYCSLFNLPNTAKYHFIEADVLNAELEPIIKGADTVFQLAAITDAAGSFKNKQAVENNNFNATVKVAEACSKVNCRLIHLSSTSVYGTQNEVVDEDCGEDELKPQSPYAHTKLKEEKFLQDLGSKGKLKFITCRFGTICGISPGMRFHTAINKFCWQAVMGEPITVWRTALHQKRPYLTLDDAMSAFTFIIKNNLFDGRIYNVLTRNMTVNNILEIIKRRINKIEIKYVDTEIMNQLSYEVLNNRFCGKGFNFAGSIEKCIEDTIKLLRPVGN
ncbi:MAG: UDP-glucose 4-epimerase [Planctomycetes bacterium ADurb.Bin401]|nr:MAG: UDP-glucose 4-epimerase [Planctomycetes bacterium ADurb.Bin401]